MGLEAANYVNELEQTNPLMNDPAIQGDDHLRLIKKCLLNSFPNIDAAVTVTPDELNALAGISSNVQDQLDALVTADSAKLPKAGGTMTGNIVLAGDPSAALHPVTKQMRDADLTNIDNTYVALAGDTLTGYLVLHAAPDADMKAANKKYVDDAIDYAINNVKTEAIGIMIGSSGSINYTRIGTTVTVAYTGQKYRVGSLLHVGSATDSGLNGTDVVVTAVGTNSLQFETSSTGAASGSLVIRCGILRPRNITNVQRVSAGVFKWTFDTPISDPDYSVHITTSASVTAIGNTFDTDRTVNDLTIRIGDIPDSHIADIEVRTY